MKPGARAPGIHAAKTQPRSGDSNWGLHVQDTHESVISHCLQHQEFTCLRWILSHDKCCRHSVAMVIVALLPGARAPGFMLSPLRGYNHRWSEAQPR